MIQRIHTEYIRLDTLMKLSDMVLSGGQAKVVIQNGEVCVNGEKCRMRGKKIRPGDTVSFSEKTVTVEAQE